VWATKIVEQMEEADKGSALKVAFNYLRGI